VEEVSYFELPCGSGFVVDVDVNVNDFVVVDEMRK
jgi:hypothetical protein